MSARVGVFRCLAQAIPIFGHICTFLHLDFESAQLNFDRALLANPNSSFAWALSASTQCYIGKPAEALRRLDKHKKLAPFDPLFPLFETIYTMAHTFLDNYEEAALVGRRSVRNNPEFSNGYKLLLAALGHIGQKLRLRNCWRNCCDWSPISV